MLLNRSFLLRFAFLFAVILLPSYQFFVKNYKEVKLIKPQSKRINFVLNYKEILTSKEKNQTQVKHEINATAVEYGSLIVSAIVFVIVNKNFIQYLHFLSTLYSSALVGILLKHYVHFIRPDGFGDNSFPSGHTIICSVAAFFLIYSTKKKLGSFSFLFLLLPFFMGLSRVLSKRHFFQDVFAGFLISLILYYLSKVFYYYAEKYISHSFLQRIK